MVSTAAAQDATPVAAGATETFTLVEHALNVTAQGSCFALNADYDNHCYETVLFADGSTIAIQGVQLGNGGPSVTTIVGGSGRYLGATGTVTVTATEDASLWTKVFEVVID
jgi:hypothetical protein